MSNFKEVQEKVGFQFKNIELLKEALTHRSYLNENPSWKLGNNERLEFLGDAVLELIVTDELFSKFPHKEEGELTIYRAGLVNTKSLTSVAQEIGLDKEILLSRGEAKDFSGRGRDSISANAVEALIGAIYLDQGYEKAAGFIGHFIMPKLPEVIESGGKDPISLIQEIAQSEYKITPTYEILDESGPAHEKSFEVGIYFDDKLMAKGKGESKQEAESEAAQSLLDKLHKN